jgi:uncharacterized protein (TIGR00369 family)
MSANHDQTAWTAMQRSAHPYCLVCSRSNPFGLGLEFELQEDGGVSTTFIGHPGLEGYAGVMHGGMIATLLDGAMTNCLFARGCRAFTAELRVRYRKPVQVGQPLTIRARLKQSAAPLHLLEAELEQQGCLAAWAHGKFMEIHE